MRESEIQKQCLDYLKALNVFHWRSNNIAVKGRVFHGLLGVPDIIVLHNGYFIGLEIKTKEGKQTKEQRDFERNCTINGGFYFVIRSIDDLISLFNAFR
jgi:hypothetical protein